MLSRTNAIIRRYEYRMLLYFKLARLRLSDCVITLWFDKQTFGFQKYSVACFDKLPLIMIDKRRRDDTRHTTVCLVWPWH